MKRGEPFAEDDFDIIGIFALSWLGSVVFYKFMRYDDLEVTVWAP